MLLSVVSAAPAAAGPSATGFDLVAAATSTVQAPPGGTAPVALTWRNAGPGPAPRAKLTFTPPTGTALAALPSGWSRSGRSAVRMVASPPVGGSRSATLRITVAASAVPGGLLVGGYFGIAGTAGTDRVPGNNETSIRVRVTAERSARPSPSARPSTSAAPTPAPTPSPRPTPTPVAAAGRAPAKPAVATTATVPPTVVPRRIAGTTRLSSPKVSTHVATPPSDAVASDVVEVVDEPRSTPSVALVPMLGAATCFTAAGFGTVVLRRRRLDARADEAERRAMRGR